MGITIIVTVANTLLVTVNISLIAARDIQRMVWFYKVKWVIIV